MSGSRSDPLALGYSSHPANPSRSISPSVNNSLVDTLSSSNRQGLGLTGGMNSSNKMAGNPRSGTGSPSHDMASSSRLFSKRAREIQAQEGVSGMPLNLWGGPPTSGNSTPLRENIPESPTDGFPDFAQLPTPESISLPRRARAGTVPSRFPGGSASGTGLLTVPTSASVKSALATPSQSPFNNSPSPSLEHSENAHSNASGSSTLLSRLRAGSMPQRSPYSNLPNSNSPFGPSIFSSWNLTGGVGRDRGATLASIASVPSNGPSSPSQQSQFSKDGGGESDVHMRTLDYLGLAETPQPAQAFLATPNMHSSNRASRFRSYSVNNKDKYADEEEADDYDDDMLESQYAAVLQGQLAATHEAIHNHNLAVQAYAHQTSRPRARTAGVLDTPGSRLMQTYLTGNAGVVLNAMAPAEIRLQEQKEYEDLSQAVAGMKIGRSNSRNAGGLLGAEEQGLELPTSALWLGGIPTSTTTSTLTEMFKPFGLIISARVLTHKNCGFVNFERAESAISAKASMNGKEIFPGAGPIRINFAKPPSASETPGHDGAFPSPSPDPFGKGQDATQRGGSASPSGDAAPAASLSNATPTVPPLREMTADIVEIVGQFGASDDDKAQISQSLQSAIQYNSFVKDIPPIREPTHTRVHDAPKLRDIRKRLDNQMYSRAELENVAVDMLPEVAELSSDYLGNIVVQKLFDQCSDQIRDAMLLEIAPHLAEIGIHKNGTWAAQKIIDVCKTPSQRNLIVEHLHQYTVPLLLDQYGNYVLQGCLKFGPPYNDFIFETMLSQMGEIAYGRYGARAMRACLESHHATKEQQRMLAAAIALHSVQLATNANGALLLTWFLDTCTFPQRRTVLSPRLVPHLVHLCTHKVAYLTVLKVINQKAEAEARDTILKALFFSPNNKILEAILNDQACGATLIFKVLTTPFFDETIRGQVVENVKSVLLRIKAQPGQGYKRLMDEVGLSTRAAGSNHRDASANAEQRQRPNSRHANTATATANGSQSQASQSSKTFGNYSSNSTPNPPQYGTSSNEQGPDNGTNGVHPSFPQYNNQGMMYNPPNGQMPPAVNLQQMQYQQGAMNRPPMTYPYPAMQPGYGYVPQPQNVPNGNSMQPPPQMPGGPAPHAPPGFNMNMGMGMGVGYGYGGNMGGMPNMGYMQPPPPPPQQQQPQEQGNGRRGRTRHSPSKDHRHGGQR